MNQYQNLPAKDARRAALQTLALAKWIQESAKNIAGPAEADAKAWLRDNELAPGDRSYALIDGDEVATVSRSKITTRPNITITDETAFGHWLVEQGHENPWQMRLADWARQQSFIEGVIKHADGEVPDGIEFTERTTGGSVSVRQTDTQREALEKHISALHEVMATFDTLTQVEGGEEA